MSKSTRKTIEEVVNLDIDKFHGPIDQSIAYLQEMKAKYSEFDITVTQVTEGYYDTWTALTYTRDETDEEMASRIELEKLQAKIKREEKARQDQRKKDEAELARLKRKLGYI